MSPAAQGTQSGRSGDIQFEPSIRWRVRALLSLLACIVIAAPMGAVGQIRAGFGWRGGFRHGSGLGRARSRGEYRIPPMDFARPGAWWADQQYLARSGVRQGQLTSLGRVIDELERRTPGRQLDTILDYQGDRLVYRVRWITFAGRRVDYLVDAATGAVLSER